MGQQAAFDLGNSWGNPPWSVAAGFDGLPNSRRARLLLDLRDGSWSILLGALCLLLAACAGPIEAVRTAPVNQNIGGVDLVDNHLMRSADYFWHMWQKIEAQKIKVP
jgi:hypothetical protein